jgi:16S rRNA (uracil1498-N3)-methyltransferase
MLVESRMPQFLVAPEDVGQGAFALKGPEAFHVVKVMRLGAGAELDLFDGKGGKFKGVIESVQADGSVTGKVTETIKADDSRAPVSLNLYLGLLKASHWDYALEKGTELGVSSFIPLLTPRTVVLLHEIDRTKAKAERWSRLIMAASKQCGRADLPPVRDAVQFRDAIRALKDRGITLIAYEGMKGSVASQTLGPALRAADGKRGKDTLEVSLFIGPEGGFSDEEIELARAEGAVVFGLGPRILRAETAAVAACALVQYELGGV